MVIPAYHDEDLEKLAAAGAHFVLTKTKIGAKTDKVAFQAWKTYKPDLAEVKRHRTTTGLLGFRPNSLGLVVVDQDHDVESPAEVLGPPLVVIPTSKPGGKHFYYRKPKGAIPNRMWADPESLALGGDIRCSNGYIMLWDAAAVASILPYIADAHAAPLEALPLYDKKIDAVRNAPEGARNNTLHGAAFGEEMQGNDPTPLVDAAAAAGQTPEEIAKTMESARKGAVTVILNEAPSPEKVLGARGTSQWAMTPLGDACRLLEHAADKLLVSRSHKGTHAIYVDNGSGVWQQSQDKLEWLILESALGWQHQVQETAMNDRDFHGHNAAKAANWAVRAARPKGVTECLAKMDQAIEALRELKMLPRGLTQCHEVQLNTDKVSLGSPNGVIDLDTGTLLPPLEGRKRLVTRTVPDPFVHDAEHEYVEDLLRHLDSLKAGYILAAFGFALRGRPSRRWYVLAGEPNGGKTTVLNAAFGCLGNVTNNGYGMSLGATAILKSRFRQKNSHDGALFGLQDARIAVAGEPPSDNTAEFDVDVLNDITGGGAMNLRDVGEKALASRPASGTLFAAVNHEQLAFLNLSRLSIADRTRILEYPELPKKGREASRVTAMLDEPEVRQASLALLVRHAKMNRGVPTDIKSVTDAVDERRDDSLGAVGVWLRDHLKVTRNPQDQVVLDVLWAEMKDYFGGETDGTIEGVDRQEAWRKARAAVKNLPKARTVRRKRTWQGVKFQNEAIKEGELPEYCERCRVSYYPPDTCTCPQDRDGGPPPGAPAADGDLNGQGGSEGMERGPHDFHIPPDLLDIYREFTRPRPVKRFHYPVERYGGGALGTEIERRLAVLRVTEGDLRAAGNPDEFLLLRAERLRYGLIALRDMHPDAILSREHVRVLGGVEVLVEILQLSMERVKVEAIDWKKCLADLRAEAVRRHKASRFSRLAGFTLAPLRWLAVRLPRR